MTDTGFALSWIDYTIMIVYFVFVLGIGWVLNLEVMGMTGSGAKYGMMTTHFYWIGAIPAMVFLALFMMPFYYGSKARSVPEYLKLRFDEKTRGLNAILFAVMTIMASGISMYALAILMEKVLGWNFHLSLVLSAAIVLGYTYLGGLSSAIYNEVLQFFIIIIGLLPIVILAMQDLGGWSGMKEQLAPVVTAKGFAADTWTTTWKYTGSAAANPLGVEWYGIARNTPLIGALPKMFIPFLIIVPGIAALVLLNKPGSGFTLPEISPGHYNYDYTIIALLKQYLPAGVLGLGITALLASIINTGTRDTCHRHSFNDHVLVKQCIVCITFIH